MDESAEDEKEYGVDWSVIPVLEAIDSSLFSSDHAAKGQRTDKVGDHIEWAQYNEADPPVGFLDGHVGLAQVSDSCQPWNDV